MHTQLCDGNRLQAILRGLKKMEYRRHVTKIIGERFFIHAARTPGDPAGFAALDAEPGNRPTGLSLCLT
jgi:hypothetical protein